MKLTLANYFDRVQEYMATIKGSKELADGHQFVLAATENGKNFDAYDEDDDIKSTIDLYLQKLTEFHNKAKKAPDKKKPVAKPAPVKKSASVKKPATKQETGKSVRPKAAPKQEPEQHAELVETIPSDIALVKRYIGLHDKEKTYDQVLSIWRAFNKAVVERKVTRDSPWKTEVGVMNKSLSEALQASEVSGSVHLNIPSAKLKAYKAIAESVEKSTGVALLLEYINISGRPGMIERATKLGNRIDRAVAAGKLKGDRYQKDVMRARQELEAYVNKENEVVLVSPYGLSGIGEIAVFGCACEHGLDGYTRSENAVIYKLLQEQVKNLSDCELDRAFSDTVAPSICKTIAHKLIETRQLTMALLRNPAKATGSRALSGFSDYDFDTEVIDMRLRHAGSSTTNPAISGPVSLSGIPVHTSHTAAPVKIMSARDLVKQEFKTIGLQGRYRELIGDPEPGFSAMIYGKPFQGKSTLAIDFAKELTPLGKVLYAAVEEGHGGTLKDKIIRNRADVLNLDFADNLPGDLSLYRFLFIDSVTDAKLNEDAFNALIKANKARGICTIGIFHATKDGKFRGGQTFAHDADIVIRVEDGIAYANGRYAAQGQMNIEAILSAAEVRNAA